VWSSFTCIPLGERLAAHRQHIVVIVEAGTIQAVPFFLPHADAADASSASTIRISRAA
jgi:uncharacterized RmlC-like cupin family protein